MPELVLAADSCATRRRTSAPGGVTGPGYTTGVES
jgi:hypothetical protein